LKAVILAAGRGERLSPYTDCVPKPLLPISGRPLIEHIVSAIKENGVTDFIIVTGYLGDIIKKRMRFCETLDVKIRFLPNPHYALGNGSSLLLTEKLLHGEESFLLTMSDHLVGEKLIEKALNGYRGESLLCVDSAPRYLTDIREAMKVVVDEKNYVRDMGKRLLEWTGVDTGVFHLNTEIFDLVSCGGTPINVSDCMKTLIRGSSLKACDVSSLPWLDIDTKKDLEYARRLMKRWV